MNELGHAERVKQLVVQHGKIDAVARCLAKLDGQFVSADRWSSDNGFGMIYRERAKEVIATIARFDAGYHSGGLP